MTENEKNFLAQSLVKKVVASEPLYRKWWIWAIAAILSVVVQAVI